jgi:hypothetical protein
MNTKENNWLKKNKACKEAVEWLQSFETIKEAWLVCERGDWMMWYLKKKLLTKKQAVELAILFAERVLPIFEVKYPDDKRPRLAIEAAKEWLKNPTAKNKKAYAAYAYAYAAYAAYAAACAAAAADDAAAAAAASDAACAAAASDDAYALLNERKEQTIIIRKLIPEL